MLPVFRKDKLGFVGDFIKNVSWILRCTDATVAIGNLFRFSVAYNHMPLSLVKETRGVRFYVRDLTFLFPIS